VSAPAGTAATPLTSTAVPVSPGRWRVVWRRFRARPAAVAGALVLVLIIAVAVGAPLLAPADPAATDFDAVLAPPGVAHHLLGTDQLGRDVLSRLCFGARASLLSAVLATTAATLVAVPIALLAGYLRGPLDALVMRVVDVLLAFPFLILAVGLAAIASPSLATAVISLAVAQLPAVVRVARGEVLAVRELEFVQAAVVSGVRTRTILRRHVLPTIANPLLVQATVSIPAMIVAAAVLSFLGLGVQPPTSDWGSMLAQAQVYINQAPWLGIFPGLAIFLTTLAFNLFGDGVRDACDVRMNP
jgi:ABC-type dipeptide/oligopeptide/nickel transport system permease subunit